MENSILKIFGSVDVKKSPLTYVLKHFFQYINSFMPFLASEGCFWPLIASITPEVKNDHAYVITQGICNKFIEANFCLGCLVSQPNHLFQYLTTMSLIDFDWKCLGMKKKIRFWNKNLGSLSLTFLLLALPPVIQRSPFSKVLAWFLLAVVKFPKSVHSFREWSCL